MGLVMDIAFPGISAFRARLRRASSSLWGLIWGLGLSIACVAQPANDTFANAELIPADRRAVRGSNKDAGHIEGEPEVEGGAGRSIWWRWECTESGPVRWSTRGSSVDTVLVVLEDDGSGLVYSVGSNDQVVPSENWSEVRTTARAGRSYWVGVDSFADPTGEALAGDIELRLTRELKVAWALPAPATPDRGTEDLVLQVSMDSRDVSIDRVEYMGNRRTVGVATTPPWRVTWKDAPSGILSLSAWVTDSDGSRWEAPLVGHLRGVASNDRWEDAVELGVGGANGTVLGAKWERGEPEFETGQATPVVWYRWRARDPRPITLAVWGRDFQRPSLQVFRGNDPSQWRPEGASQRGSLRFEPIENGYREFAYTTITPVEQETYFIAVGNEFANAFFRLVLGPAVSVSLREAGLGGLRTETPGRFRLEAIVDSPAYSVRKVEYRYGSDALKAGLSSDPWTTDLTLVRPGPYDLRAVAVDDSGIPAISSPTPVEVTSRASDAFERRVTLVGASAAGEGSTFGAGWEPGEPRHEGRLEGRSEWWTWTAVESGQATVQLSGRDTEHALPVQVHAYVYQGSRLDALTPVPSVRTWDSQLFRSYEFPVVSGESYAIAVDSERFSETDYVLRIAQGRTPRFAVDMPGYLEQLKPGDANPVRATIQGDRGIARYEVRLYSASISSSTWGVSGVGDRIVTDFRPTTAGPHELWFLATDDAGLTGLLRYPVEVVSPNDMFRDAAEIGPAAGKQVLLGDTTGAGREAGEPFHNDGNQGNSLWWRWTAPASGWVILEAEGRLGFDAPVFRVYEGTGPSQLQVRSTVWRDGRKGFRATRGTTYWLAVEGEWVEGEFDPRPPGLLSGPFAIHWTFEASSLLRIVSPEPGASIRVGETVQVVAEPLEPDTAPNTAVLWGSSRELGETVRPSYRWKIALTEIGEVELVAAATQDPHLGLGSPSVKIRVNAANDLIANAEEVRDWVVPVRGGTHGAGTEEGEPLHGQADARRSVWYHWRSPVDRVVLLETESPSGGAGMAIYSGHRFADWERVDVALVRDLPTVRGSVLSARAGVDYWLAVYAATDTAFTISERSGIEIQVSPNRGNPIQNTDSTMNFRAVVRLSNRMSRPSGAVRLRTVAISGYSAVRGMGTDAVEVRELGMERWEDGFPVGGGGQTLVAGRCPPPEPLESELFGRGWGVWLVVEEEISGRWIPVGSRELFEGVWPVVNGFNGPGGGIIDRVGPRVVQTSLGPKTVIARIWNESGGSNVVRAGDFVRFRLSAEISDARETNVIENIAAVWTTSASFLWKSNVVEIPSDAGPGEVEVTAGYELIGPYTRASATLQILPALRAPWLIRQTPGPVDLKSGESLVLEADVGGVPEPDLQWEKNGVVLPGMVQRRLSIVRVSEQDAGEYRLTARNSEGRWVGEPILVRVETGRPRLQISAAGIAVISVPGTAGVVEQTQSLGPGANWVLVAGFVCDAQGKATVSWDQGAAETFFRARVP